MEANLRVSGAVIDRPNSSVSQDLAANCCFFTRSLIFGGCSTRVFPRVLKTEPGTRGGRAAGGEPLLPPGPRLQRRRPRVLLRRGGDF